MIDYREKIWELSGGKKNTYAEAYKKVWNDLGGNENWLREFRLLADLYWEHHRAYHRMEHPLSMLEGFYRAIKHGVAVENPSVFPLAIFHHDAICLPWAKDNETRSAALHEAVCARANRSALIDPGRGLIMVTATHEPKTSDEALMVDLDLMILGVPEPFYDRYMRDIRIEYGFYPAKEYCAGRIVLLERFLRRAENNTLYSTPFFKELYETQARKNLQREIGLLREWETQLDITGI